ncbi:hypothetical protein [Metabacillus halosaccharovorans]|uniref:Uncharacterized protein n=1 Tax=Metabacillus halosaccharovorans TaxID=930124 RepID=A0ABT3DBW4_9BACI|nr:hypothetical protein [Metabacillus halosaccharovorans]MCV9884530.1 hypothetical protein [Metabacillus halosaccharovorans]
MINQESSAETETYETTYKEGFPIEASPTLSKFIQNYINGSSDRELLNQDGTLVFSDSNGNEDQTSVTYYQFTEEQLKGYYEPLFQTDDPNMMLYDLKQTDSISKLRSPVNDTDQYSLPSVTMKDNNQLEIKITENQRTIDLNEAMKDYGVSSATKFILNIEAINKNNIVFVLEDVSKIGDLNELYYLFVDQALSDFTITQFKYKETQEVFDTNKLKPYYDLFPGDGNYRSGLDKITILNVETNKITEIKDNDLLSEDGKFVYLKGAAEELSDGEQRIQTIENYAKGNDIYEEQFEIDFDTISKQLNFETNKISIARTNYFNGDYIVLRLLYKGKTIGDGGVTNVIVDLQNKKTPTAYLVDLGIE